MGTEDVIKLLDSDGIELLVHSVREYLSSEEKPNNILTGLLGTNVCGVEKVLVTGTGAHENGLGIISVVFN